MKIPHLINPIPPRKEEHVQRFLRHAGIVFASIALLCVSISWWWSKHVRSVQHKEQILRTSIRQHEEKHHHLQHSLQTTQKTQEQEKKLQRLYEHPYTLHGHLDELANRLPYDLYLTTCNFNRDRSFVITGNALTSEAINVFIEEITTSPLFASITLQEVVEKDYNQESVYAFTLHGMLHKQVT